MTDADKVRFLAELAGWEPPEHSCGDPNCFWNDAWIKGDVTDLLADYPHSLDAIARDLLPLLREKGWEHALRWQRHEYSFAIWGESDDLVTVRHGPEPARAAFEAIFGALHGGEE